MIKTIIAVVPMKLNNSRLPGKNTRQFTNGSPLCSYVLNTLRQIKSIADVYVFCSNPDIQGFIPDGVKYLRRSPELDKDSTTMNEVLESFAKEIPADIYLLAHATAPFIGQYSIERGIKAVVEGKYDSAFSVSKLQDFLWKDGKPFNYDMTFIPRTQDLEMIYMETSGFYIFRKEILEEKGRRIGDKPLLVEVSSFESIDIDEEEDFIMADALNYYNENVMRVLGGGKQP